MNSDQFFSATNRVACLAGISVVVFLVGSRAEAQQVTLGSAWQANAGGVDYATLTNNSASGYEYRGIGPGASEDLGL